MGKITNITCQYLDMLYLCTHIPIKTSDKRELTHKSAASQVLFPAKDSYWFLATRDRRQHRKWLNFPSGHTEVTYSIVLQGDMEDDQAQNGDSWPKVRIINVLTEIDDEGGDDGADTGRHGAASHGHIPDDGGEDL